MTWIVCLDDADGMMFGGRRQSKDRVLREHMLSFCAGRTLWVSPYSASQFDEQAALTVDADYADKMASGDVCFIEDGAFPATPPQTVLIYRWNRRYPSDNVFPTAMLSEYDLVTAEEFVGSSHERITALLYKRKETVI